MMMMMLILVSSLALMIHNIKTTNHPRQQAQKSCKNLPTTHITCNELQEQQQQHRHHRRHLLFLFIKKKQQQHLPTILPAAAPQQKNSPPPQEEHNITIFYRGGSQRGRIAPVNTLKKTIVIFPCTSTIKNNKQQQFCRSTTWARRAPYALVIYIFFLLIQFAGGQTMSLISLGRRCSTP